jgi:hypothetical protein
MTNDEEIILELRRIDESQDIEVDEWEAEFLDSIKKMPKPRHLSPKQKAAAERMIEKYLKK